MSLFRSGAKKESAGKVREGVLFFGLPRPLLESVKIGEEVVWPGGKNPMCGSNLQRGNLVWAWAVSDLALGEKVVECRREKRLEVGSLERMETNTGGSHKGKILLRR